FPVGATIGPLLLTALAGAGVSWRFGFALLGGAYVALAVALARFLDPPEAPAVSAPSPRVPTMAGMAAIFPTLVALTVLRARGARAATMIGYQVAAAAVGAAIIPGGVGLLVSWRSVEVIGPVVVSCLLLMVLLDRANAHFVRKATCLDQAEATTDALRCQELV